MLYSYKRPVSFIRIPLEGVAGHLYASPMPFGPYDKMNQLLKTYVRNKVACVVILTTAVEIEKKARKDIRGLYQKYGMEFLHCPIEDFTAPSVEALEPLIREIVVRLETQNVVVHCNAGVGRTGVVLAATLSELEQVEPDQMLNRLSKYLAIQVTDEQRRVVNSWWTQTHAS